MKIYTREEWNALPPKSKLLSGLTKRYFVIHHTASGNGMMSLDAEKRQQKAWQIMHMGAYTNYKGQDILQAASIFKSGRVFEGRRPWTSNNGAAYNAGYDGFGIEIDGTFYGKAYMDLKSVQYRSLVEFCAWAHINVPVPLKFLGHRQIPGNDTACPGNLLEQFIDNGKLQQDVLTVVAKPPEEEDGMAFCRESGTIGKDKIGHAFIGPLAGCHENLTLHFTGLADGTNITVQVYNDGETEDLKRTVDLDKHVQISLEDSGLTGTVTWHAYSKKDFMVSPDWRSIKQ